jgi:anti-sigma factor RsiW
MSDATAVDPEEIPDEIIVALSDYLDGTCSPAERADVEQKLAADAQWKRAHAELTETRKFMSGLQKAHTDDKFVEDVTSTIHKRSQGRFFGKRTFGDRVPFGALLIVALIGLAVIGYVMWSSSTGSLKVDHERGSAGATDGSGLVPRP